MTGYEGLIAKKPPRRPYWGRIPESMREQVVATALEHTELSPRELACRITDRESHFLSEFNVYRILKADDLVVSAAYVVMSASERFQHPTRRPNELWQTDFTYLRVVAGADLMSRDAQGNTRRLRVHKIEGDTATLDFNHPMAVRTLIFDLKMLEIR